MEFEKIESSPVYVAEIGVANVHVHAAVQEQREITTSSAFVIVTLLLSAVAVGIRLNRNPPK